MNQKIETANVQRRRFGKHKSLWSELGLRRNPFGEVPPHERADLMVGDVSGWIEHLRGDKCAVQLTGEGGRGKSTHLRAIHRAYPEAFFLYIREGEKPSIPLEPRLFLDETQRLPWWKREWIFRHCRSLAIATHELHTKQLERLGFSVITQEFVGLSLEKLAAVVERRIAWARRGEEPKPTIMEATLRRYLAKYDDNLRAIEHELYEEFQQPVGSSDVQIRFEN